LEKDDARRSDEGVEREKEQEDEAEKKLEWGGPARIRRRKVAEARFGMGRRVMVMSWRDFWRIKRCSALLSGHLEIEK